VKLVLRLQPGPSVDLARLFRNDDRWATFTETASPFYHSDFETAGTLVGIDRSSTGMEGLRTFWLDWLAPWATYRTEPEEAIDLGERVLVLSHSFGRLEGSTQEVKEAPAAVWTVRDRKIARVDLYLDRAEALKAVGLEESAMSQESTTPDLIEVTGQSVDAMNRRDLDAAMSYFATDAVWDASQIGIGTFVGVSAIRTFQSDWLATFEELTVDMAEIVDMGNGVIYGICVLTGRLAGGGEVHQRWAAVNTFVDGLYVRVEAYLNPDEARASAERLAEERG
jgi:ketosteroid isomerase-like protein